MKGYMLAPVIFIIILLAVAVFFLHASESDRLVSTGVNMESGLMKDAAMASKSLSAMFTTAAEVLYYDTGVFNTTRLSSAVHDRILQIYGVDAGVSITPVAGGRNITLSLDDYSVGGDYSMTMNGDRSVLVGDCTFKNGCP